MGALKKKTGQWTIFFFKRPFFENGHFFLYFLTFNPLFCWFLQKMGKKWAAFLGGPFSYHFFFFLPIFLISLVFMHYIPNFRRVLGVGGMGDWVGVNEGGR